MKIHGHILASKLSPDFDINTKLYELPSEIRAYITDCMSGSDLSADILAALGEIGVTDIGDDLLKYLRIKVSEAIKEDKAYDISFNRNGALAYNYVVDVAIHLNDFIEELNSRQAPAFRPF